MAKTATAKSEGSEGEGAPPERSTGTGSRGAGSGTTGTPGGLASRWAGGAAALVLVAGSVVGLVAGARTAHLYLGFQASMQDTLRASAGERLRSAARRLATEVVAADAVDDWSALQARLPERAQSEKDAIALCVTDAEGLVLADVDPAHNGHPLADDRLALLGPRGESTPTELPPTEILLAGRPSLVTAVRAGDARLVWASIETRAEREARARLEQEARSAIRLDWMLVGLGTLIALIVSVGTILLVSGGLARRLGALAWRIGELGRGDYSTHLQIGGPAELTLIGDELAIAARRIDAAAQARAREAALASQHAAQRVVVTDALDGPVVLGSLSVAAALAAGEPPGCAVGIFTRADGRAVVVLIEVASATFEDALLAAQLRASAAALAAVDLALPPLEALRRLDALVGDGRRARACWVSLEASPAGPWTARIALAGARLPLLRSTTEGTRALVLQGDRVGEPDAQRGAEHVVKLGHGDLLVLTGDAPLDAGRPLDGHPGRALRERLDAASTTLSAEDQARDIVARDIAASGELPRPSVAVVIGVGSGMSATADG